MSTTLRVQALEHAQCVAKYLSNSYKLDMLAKLEPLIDASSIHTGLAGSALLHARLGVFDVAHADTARLHVAHAAKLMRGGPASGVLYGPGSVIAAGQYAAAITADVSGYEPLLEAGPGWLRRRVRALIGEGRILAAAGVPWEIYDAASGLSGLARVLVSFRQQVSGATAAADEPLVEALEYLVALAPAHGRDPGWWSVRGDNPAALDTGLAHGAAGILAALALAAESGVNVLGQDEAMRAIAMWLRQVCERDESGRASWPSYVPVINGAAADPVAGRRQAWCYGTPGISRALYLAGRALADGELMTWAVELFGALADGGWEQEDAMLCHGYAGILQVATRMSLDTGDERAGRVADEAAARVVELFDPAAVFGYQYLHGGRWRDVPGALVGAAGVELALVDYALDPSPAASWDSVFLLN